MCSLLCLQAADAPEARSSRPCINVPPYTCSRNVIHLPAGVFCRLLLQTPLLSRCSHSHPRSAGVLGISQAFCYRSSLARPPVPCTEASTVMQFAGLHVKTFAQKHNHWLPPARATSTKGQRHCTGLRGALLAARTMGGPLQSSAQVGRVSAEANLTSLERWR